jgi:hypothetical protein
LVEHIRGKYPLTIIHKEQINLPRIDWLLPLPARLTH